MIHVSLLIALLLTLGCQHIADRSVAAVNRPPQFVLLAFDGSKSLSMWQETREFARRNNVKFTYFVSGVYFIANSDKTLYAEPARGLGQSAIGWGGTADEIQARNQHVVAAISEGHEIASHANGHFDGSKYSALQWEMELRQFRDIMRNGWELYGRKKPSRVWNQYFDKNLIGFRAPQLGHSSATLNVLNASGYTYDTSKVENMSYWPQKIMGIWNFPLAGLRIEGTSQRTLSMDYNFYVADSNGKPGPATEWSRYEEQMYNTYIRYFQNNYYGNRAPVDIGHHFSRWNGGAYWKAMQRFAQSVCSLPEVECVTYRELNEFLNQADPATIKQYQAGSFEKWNHKVGQLPLLPIKASSVTNKELSSSELKQLIEDLPPIPHNEEDIQEDIEI